MSVEMMQETSRRVHRTCIACGQAHPFGLRLQFTVDRDGSVSASLDCRAALEGYEGRLHGGMIALLIDAAMTHCLFAHGWEAVTCDLRIRFLSPVATGRPVNVRARPRPSSPPLLLVDAEVLQQGRVKATARAKIMDQPA
jgi:uncharacterized protein (TIGR00369 family)